MSESVVGNIPTFKWDSKESVAYEVALEAAAQAMAAYTALIEQAKADSDAQRVEQLRQGRRKVNAARDAIRSTDAAGVAELTRTCHELTLQLREQLR